MIKWLYFQNLTSALTRAQNEEPPATYWDVDEEDEDDQWTEEQVPLDRMQKMEKQMLGLRRENQLLRNKLEMSVRLIEDNLRRIERLEKVVHRKEE